MTLASQKLLYMKAVRTARAFVQEPENVTEPNIDQQI